MPNYNDALQLLRIATGNPTAEFREGQWEAIDLILNQRRRALVVQKTSWGKSMVYFIATWLLRNAGNGPAIVISPLLALMRDQVEGAQKIGLSAVTINSSNTYEHPEIKKKIESGDVDLLIVSPEKIACDYFIGQYLAPILYQVSFLVVDEAHCISDWGHDFRPDYRRIARLLEGLPAGIPVLATTATANNRVVEDVLSQLGEGAEVIRGSLLRRSLQLDCVKIDDPAARLAWLTRKLQLIDGSGIVYVLTQRDADRVAQWLQGQGISAEAYHGGVVAYRRKEHENALIQNEVKCLVATSALGMGFDKPDLKFVIHFQAPASVVDYYQQVGRAGRGIDNAYGYLVYGAEDVEINQHFRTSAFPPRQCVDRVIYVLSRVGGVMSSKDIMCFCNIRDRHLKLVLKFLASLDPAPIAKIGGRWFRTHHPYNLDEEQIARLTRLREAEWDDIVAYGTKQECLMKFLAKKLDDPNPVACGKCSVCTGIHSLPNDYDPAVHVEALQFLNRSELPLVPKKRFADPDLGRNFGMRNSNIPEQYRPQEGRVLARYGEPVIGKLVQQGKQAGEFSHGVLNAASEMVQNRWPEGAGATWVTCIPSLRHPGLVPAFAQNLANQLGLPFVDSLTKVLDTEPQKTMENRYYQCKNLLNAFEVTIPDDFIGQPVLLIDDISDSGWTLTIASFQLLRAGSGPVFPMTLATSKPSG